MTCTRYYEVRTYTKATGTRTSAYLEATDPDEAAMIVERRYAGRMDLDSIVVYEVLVEGKPLMGAE
jgi:hypothetical protein